MSLRSVWERYSAVAFPPADRPWKKILHPGDKRNDPALVSIMTGFGTTPIWRAALSEALAAAVARHSAAYACCCHKRTMIFLHMRYRLPRRPQTTQSCGGLSYLCRRQNVKRPLSSSYPTWYPPVVDTPL